MKQKKKKMLYKACEYCRFLTENGKCDKTTPHVCISQPAMKDAWLTKKKRKMINENNTYLPDIRIGSI